jgi:hypothetical protein
VVAGLPASASGFDTHRDPIPEPPLARPGRAHQVAARALRLRPAARRAAPPPLAVGGQRDARAVGPADGRAQGAGVGRDRTGGTWRGHGDDRWPRRRPAPAAALGRGLRREGAPYPGRDRAAAQAPAAAAEGPRPAHRAPLLRLPPRLRRAPHQAARGESRRLVVESPWSQFTSECQRFRHPPRLDK